MKIKILAEDIRTAGYCDIYDCPIIRAMKRAGIQGDITASGWGAGSVGENYDIEKANSMVIAMYKTLLPDQNWGDITAIPIEDFEAEIFPI